MRTVTDADNLPTGPDYAYHVAPAEDAESILMDGIDPTQSPDTWSALDALLEHVAAAEHISSKPSHRADCAFAYAGRKRGTDPTVHLSGYVTLAIRLPTITSPIYAASYPSATTVHHAIVEQHPEWSSRQSSVPSPLSEDAYNAAVEYWTTLREYSPGTDTISKSDELLVEGVIPPEAVTHVLEG